VGAGAYAAGLFHVVTHAFFKALLFLGAGSVIHALHHAYHHSQRQEDAQDMRNMGGLRTFMPWTAALMWLATFAIAGIPGFSGFFSKDEILARTFARGHDAPVFYLLWAIGVATALLTAFYMTRLMLYTFHGPSRVGDAARPHLHEAPWIMTAPLLVLGLLTIVGGALNVPELFGGHTWLHHWLEPVTAPAAALAPPHHVSHAVEWTLVALAVLIAGAGITLAFRLLKPAALVPAKQAAPEAGLGRLLWKKWYVDEIYDAVIVRPLAWLSREVLWKRVDQGLIDGVAVNGAAATSRALGWIGARLQTGQLGFYVVVFMVGVVAVVAAAAR
jgi:NADH-quinone oxidoreductase subunit L